MSLVVLAIAAKASLGRAGAFDLGLDDEVWRPERREHAAMVKRSCVR